MAADGQLFIRGRKKEMIVTPEGLNVFPEDVERVLTQIAGVRESAVVGAAEGTVQGAGACRARADSGVDPDAVGREANAKLEEHQEIRRAVDLARAGTPRTEGTRKLKRAAIREWLRTGGRPVGPALRRTA